MNKYTQQTLPSYITLKKDFVNSKMEHAIKYIDNGITDLKFLHTEMNKVTIRGKSDMTGVDVAIHILSNLPKDCMVQVNELKETLQDMPTIIMIKDTTSKSILMFLCIQKQNKESRVKE